MTVARRWSVNIDLTGYALVHAMMDPVSSDPSGLGTGDAGRLWFRTDVPTLKYWSGTAAIDLLARATHTGSQTASTISDFTSAVEALPWEAMAAPTSPVGMNSQQFSSLPAASSSGQAVEYAQFQTALTNLKAGLDFKGTQATVVATSNVSLSAPGATISGHTMASGDTMLLTGQTTGTQNGLYAWNGASATATRTPDTATTGSIFSGTLVAVGDAGTTFPGSVWMQTIVGTGANGAITIGTDTMTWTQPFTATSYTAGNGISISSFVISAVANTGVTVTGSGIGADFSKVSQYVESIVPTSTTGAWTISGAVATYNHALSSYAVDAHIFVYTSPASGFTQGDEIGMYMNRPDTNNISITLPAAPSSNNWIVRIAR